MQAVCSWPVCYWPLEYYWMSLLLQLYLNTEFIHAVRYTVAFGHFYYPTT